MPDTSNKRPLWMTIVAVIVVAAIYLLWPAGSTAPSSTTSPPRPPPSAATTATATPAPASPTQSGDIARLFARQESGVWVESSGRVSRILPDDTSTDGGANARHERLLVLVSTRPDLTILIAHNIDLAPRVPVKEGDSILFRGRYEWSEKGGTVHFTHAPERRSRSAGEGGWIEHNGKHYD